MDEQKKQKLMIGVLAVAILGAGAFFWMNSQSKTSGSAQANAGPVQRRKRKEPAKVDKKPARRARDTTRQRNKTNAPKVTRRQRKDTGPKTTSRRRKGRTNQRKQKKVDRLPAG